MNDLLSRATTPEGYTAQDIEVLEGLEPVRRRPGMYVGGTDEGALHHLAAEILDNSMDEAVAGHASTIDVTLEPGNWLTVGDNGRGIPVDPHPKFKTLSALEVILTTLHSGGKFGGKAYATSGGLHGVGSSVVNALSDEMQVEVARDRALWRQSYARGKPTSKLVNAGATQNRRGTTIRFHPDPEIFGTHAFSPARLYRLCRSKAYLFRGVRIRWRCDESLVRGSEVPAEAVLHFPGGLRDSLADDLGDAALALPGIWAGDVELAPNASGPAAGLAGGRAEWALAWVLEGEGVVHSYCNTVPTPQGGTHEQGFRAALLKGLRNWGEQRGKKIAQITADDVMGQMAAKLSAFVREPQFQGQTKGEADQPRGRAPRGAGHARPLRPLARRRPGPGGRAAGLRRGARRGSACAGRTTRMSDARPPHAACACRASWPIARGRAGTTPRSSSSKATALAAARSRPATAKRRPCSRCGARS